MEKSGHNDHNDERDEEEALSLCDLPIKFLRKDDESVTSDVDEERKSSDEIVGEEFNFIGPSSSSFESEMCVADELFFQGQILPLQRLSSVSSDGLISGHLHCQHHRDEQNCTMTCSSTGEHYFSTSRSTSSSSRSNISSRSNSINSTISNTITTNYNTKSKSKIIDHFHTHPSPKPQIKLSTLRPATTGNGRRQNSSVWEFLRVGLVRTPEMELQNLKLRTNKKNTSVNPSRRNISSNSNSRSISSKNNDSKLNKYKRLDGSSSILSGFNCKCSIDVVEKTVTSRPRKVVLLKCKSGGSRIDTEEMKEKLLQHSSDRTFEWLKHLSVESTDDRL